MPRPTRTFLMREPCGGCKFDRLKDRLLVADLRGVRALRGPLLVPFFAISLLHHSHQVTHFMDHAANCRRVLALNHLMHSPQPYPAYGLRDIVGRADEADHLLNLDGAL